MFYRSQQCFSFVGNNPAFDLHLTSVRLRYVQRYDAEGRRAVGSPVNPTEAQQLLLEGQLAVGDADGLPGLVAHFLRPQHH